MPWDVERMTPTELNRFHEGWLWRRSRNMRVLAVALGWVGGMIRDRESDLDDEMIARSFPGYRPE